MNIKIRKGTFETNSSSTHSLTMCMEDQFEAWKNGKLFYVHDCWSSDSEFAKKDFVTFEEAQDIILKDRYNSPKSYESITREFIEDHQSDYQVFTYEGFIDYNSNLEFFEDSFTTPSGEKVVAFGNYGYDG